MKRTFISAFVVFNLLITSLFAFAAEIDQDKQYIVRFEKGESLQKVDKLSKDLGFSHKKLGIINGIVFKGNQKAMDALSRKMNIVAIEEDQIMRTMPGNGGGNSGKGGSSGDNSSDKSNKSDNKNNSNRSDESKDNTNNSGSENNSGGSNKPETAGKPDRTGKPPKEVTEEPETPAESIDWGIMEIKADLVWDIYTGAYFENGIDKSVRVAVIDTGIDISHEDLYVAGGVNFVSSAKSYDDDNGHGTHVAGTIAAVDNELGLIGAAHGVKLYAVKALDRRGSGYFSDIIRGIDWSVANEMDVINMSLGSNSNSPSMYQALEVARLNGIIAVAAAGNDASDIDYPAAYINTIAVGAVDSNLEIAYFSSHGSQLDVVAPGVEINSTYKNNGYRVLNGTSMASPHVAAVAALFKQKYPEATVTDFRFAIQEKSIDLGNNGYDEYYGNGLIDAVEILNYILKN